MFASEPVHDPFPGELVQVSEGPTRHAVPEVAGPAPQHLVDAAEQFATGRWFVPILVIVFTFARIEVNDFFEGQV